MKRSLFMRLENPTSVHSRVATGDAEDKVSLPLDTLTSGKLEYGRCFFYWKSMMQ